MEELSPVFVHNAVSTQHDCTALQQRLTRYDTYQLAKQEEEREREAEIDA